MKLDYIIYRFAILGLVSMALVACGSDSVYTNIPETESTAGSATGGDTNTAGNTTTDNEQNTDSGTLADDELDTGSGNTDLTLSLSWIESVGQLPVSGSPLVSDAELIITHGRTNDSESAQIKAFRANGLIENWAPNPNSNSERIQAYAEVAGDLNGNVYALRKLDDDDAVRLVTRSATGELMPDYQGGGMGSRTAPSIDASGRVIFIKSDDDIIAVREQDGTVKLIRDANIGYVRTKPAISRANIAYFTNHEEGLVGVNLSTGERNFCSGSEPSWSSPAIAGNNHIIFGTRSGRIMACADTMSRVWSYPDDDLAAANANGCNPMTDNSTGTNIINVTGSPVIDEASNVYIRSHNGYIYALNAEGKLRWCHDTGESGASPFGDNVPTTTPILTANGLLIYIGDKGVSALNKVSGELVLRLTDAELLSTLSSYVTSPTITQSGLLVFRAGFKLVAIETNTTLDTDAFWPKWGADLKNSGLQR